MSAGPDWDAATYHRVADPQTAWGRAILERIELRGTETIVDIGCGSGRLTADLVSRVPHGRVIAVDISNAMLTAARRHLAGLGSTPASVRLVRADAAHLPFNQAADVLFSTATFHWVLDHIVLFRSIFAALRPGGRLVAQCGGGPNLARLLARVKAIASRATFASAFLNWNRPCEFADDTTTKLRLHQAGFVRVETSLTPAPTSFSDAGQFREFVRTVVLRPHLAVISDAHAGEMFLDEIVSVAGADDPPYTLDYWRLNISAVRPG